MMEGPGPETQAREPLTHRFESIFVRSNLRDALTPLPDVFRDRSVAYRPHANGTYCDVASSSRRDRGMRHRQGARGAVGNVRFCILATDAVTSAARKLHRLFDLPR